MAFPRPERERERERASDHLAELGTRLTRSTRSLAQSFGSPKAAGPIADEAMRETKAEGPAPKSRESQAPHRGSRMARGSKRRGFGEASCHAICGMEGSSPATSSLGTQEGAPFPCCVSVAPRAEARVPVLKAGEPGGGESRRAECALSVLVSPAGVRR